MIALNIFILTCVTFCYECGGHGGNPLCSLISGFCCCFLFSHVFLPTMVLFHPPVLFPPRLMRSLLIRLWANAKLESCLSTPSLVELGVADWAKRLWSEPSWAEPNPIPTRPIFLFLSAGPGLTFLHTFGGKGGLEGGGGRIGRELGDDRRVGWGIGESGEGRTHDRWRLLFTSLLLLFTLHFLLFVIL